MTASVPAPPPTVRRTAVRLPLGTGPAIDPFALAAPGPDPGGTGDAGGTGGGMVFCAEGRVRVGLGVGWSIDLDGGLSSSVGLARVMSLLAGVGVDDRLARGSHPADAGRAGPAGGAVPGSAVVAFGALPFDRHAPARLVVPELLYAADPDGAEWATLLSGGPASFPRDPQALREWLVARSTDPVTVHPNAVAPPPRITPRSSDDAFRAMVASALQAINRGELAKVVLARQVDVAMHHTIDVADLLRRWHRLEPNCAVFSLPTPGGQFVGASPELLVERDGQRVRSRPLAGTSERQPEAGPGPGQLLRSGKDGNEHRLVVEAIEQVLAPLCTELEVPEGPALVHLHTITHLGTSLAGTLAPGADGTGPGVLQLLALLHPTPAVGGVPTAAAERCIDGLEPEPRGHYAGPVGVVDAEGNGTWMVGIRAMSVRGGDARLAAGVGVVAGSDPDRELAEANLKLAAVFEALAPGEVFTTEEHPPGEEAGPERASRAVS